MTSKNHILKEVRRVTAANNGKPPGEAVFRRETGIKKYDWYPHIWLRWSEVLIEAGFKPNKLQGRLEDSVVFDKYIQLTRELGKFPVSGELVLKAKTDKSFPTQMVFARFGGKNQLIEALLAYAQGSENLSDILQLCQQHLSGLNLDETTSGKTSIKIGFVYLMKSGRHYKIGKTNSVLRRSGELKIQIPVPPTTVHSIETDDPSGIEAYWHRRFADKRGEGEWFELSPQDVATFKRWKRIA